MLNYNFTLMRQYLDRAQLADIRRWREDYHLAYYRLLAIYLDAGMDLALDFSSAEAYDYLMEAKQDVFNVYHAYQMHHNTIVKRSHRGRQMPVKRPLSLAYAKQYLEEALPQIWNEKMLIEDPEKYDDYDDLERFIERVLERMHS